MNMVAIQTREKESYEILGNKEINIDFLGFFLMTSG